MIIGSFLSKLGIFDVLVAARSRNSDDYILQALVISVFRSRSVNITMPEWKPVSPWKQWVECMP